jgi:CRISPR-associated exonuclease Cas4
MIDVRDLSLYSYCPRKLFIRRVLNVSEPQNPMLAESRLWHLHRRELSLRFAKVANACREVSELKKSLSDEAKKIVSEIPKIYALTQSSDQGLFLKALEDDLLYLCDELSYVSEQIGFKAACDFFTPWKIDYHISSDSLGLRGCIDKVLAHDSFVPAMIKTTNLDRTSRGDRLRLCALGMLLEDKHDKRVGYGLVEFSKTLHSQPIRFSENLRRDVLRIRDEILDLLDGQLPEICIHGEPRRCEACGLSERCFQI